MRRVQLDGPAKTAAHRHISARDVRERGGGDGRPTPGFIVHPFITLTVTASVSGISTYKAGVIKGFGYGAVRANAMASVGTSISAVMLILLGWLAGRTRRADTGRICCSGRCGA